MSAVLPFFVLVAITTLYFTPTIVALGRNHRNAVGIGVLNFFTGWTGLGWIGSLVWAVSQ